MIAERSPQVTGPRSHMRIGPPESGLSSRAWWHALPDGSSSLGIGSRPLLRLSWPYLCCICCD